MNFVRLSKRTRIAALTAIFVVASTFAYAQGGATSSISGTVTDPQGGVPGDPSRRAGIGPWRPAHDSLLEPVGAAPPPAPGVPAARGGGRAVRSTAMAQPSAATSLDVLLAGFLCASKNSITAARFGPTTSLWRPPGTSMMCSVAT